MRLLGEDKLTKKKAEQIVRIVMQAQETKDLRNEMRSLVKKGLASLATLKGKKEPLQLLIESAMEDLA